MRTHLPLKILAVVLATVFMAFLLLYAVGAVIFYGPSPAAKEEFVSSLSENPNTSFIINLYPEFSVTDSTAMP